VQHDGKGAGETDESGEQAHEKALEREFTKHLRAKP
jgi:hypothetical protein